MKRLFFLILATVSFNLSAQTDKATTKKIVAAKDFTFVATTALPMNSVEMNNIINRMPGAVGGGNINLMSNDYDLRITPDSVIAYLPYYGRAFNSAPMNPTEGGYKFTSTDFSFNNKEKKKGGWEITLNAKDTKDGVRMTLVIGTNGYATLIVNSNNKQSITYNGYLTEPKKSGA
ncbi:MAG: DUF4251 domain-containing protein [Pedobacter sp.]|nr:MAG: DUF4251 domain-containing protein [Pedobacter sp.]